MQGSSASALPPWPRSYLPPPPTEHFTHCIHRPLIRGVRPQPSLACTCYRWAGSSRKSMSGLLLLGITTQSDGVRRYLLVHRMYPFPPLYPHSGHVWLPDDAIMTDC